MSFAAFITEMSGLTVSGVQTALAYVPPSLNASDLPALWLQSPRSGEETDMTLAGRGGWVDASVDVIIAIKATIQGTPSENFSAAVAMMDNLRAALKALNTATKARLRWTISQVGVSVANVDYWAVKATVTGKV